jgi:hypothetical protein
MMTDDMKVCRCKEAFANIEEFESWNRTLVVRKVASAMPLMTASAKNTRQCVLTTPLCCASNCASS